jgi:hypothetical protein
MYGEENADGAAMFRTRQTTYFGKLFFAKFSALQNFASEYLARAPPSAHCGARP